MTKLRIAFSNISQGLWYQGKKNGTHVYSKYWPSAFKQQYLELQPDVICFAEAPLDDEQGNSAFIEDVAKSMGAASYFTDVHEKSWLIEGKWYGTAIISKYPLIDYGVLKMQAPHIEVDRPDGSHWVLHDKSIQAATIKTPNANVRLFNLHYFPFHYFNHTLNEPEFESTRRQLVDFVKADQTLPTIIAGDFNNDDDDLDVAFSELFQDDLLHDAIQFGPEQLDESYNGRHQLDHVLYSPKDLRLVRAEIIRDKADHRGILTEFEFGQGADD
jgi:endonuclease/exonuclease/phosphatase (EEP) superfamily protein YafD